VARTLTSWGAQAVHTGEWTLARLRLERAIALARPISSPVALMTPLWFLGLLGVAEGRWDEATQHLDEVVVLGEQTTYLLMEGFAHGMLAERDILAGRPGAACVRLAPLIERDGWDRSELAFILKQLAWARVELGDSAGAEAAAARATAITRAESNRLDQVEAARVQALVCIEQGRWTDARRLIDEGLSLTQHIFRPHIEARLLHLEGILHARTGETERARERLAEAHAIFARLGARPEATRVEQAIAALAPNDVEAQD